ncbi:Protein ACCUMULATION AND REPLICATION OF CHLOROPLASTS 6 [Dionaea muscipula]
MRSPAGARHHASAAIVRLGAEATAVLDNVRASAVKALRKVFPRSPDEESIGYQEDIQINDTIVAGNECRAINRSHHLLTWFISKHNCIKPLLPTAVAACRCPLEDYIPRAIEALRAAV